MPFCQNIIKGAVKGLLLCAAAIAGMTLLASCGGAGDADAVNISATDIIINEVLSSNSGSAPAYDGRYYDWVELYNPLFEACSLDGYFLSDNFHQLRKCPLDGQQIPPRGYLLIYCSGLHITDEKGVLHTNFKLSAAKGETLYLSNDDRISELAIPAAEPDVSYGLDENTGRYTWFAEPTPGARNRGAAETQAADVVINEYMLSNTYTVYDCEGDYGDWVELCNTGKKTADLGGCGLTDNSGNAFKFVFPAGTEIQPGECLLVFCDGKNKRDDAGIWHTNFSLSVADGAVSLFSPERVLIDEAALTDLPENISCGRADGETGLRLFARPTPGAPNTTPWVALSAKVTPDINDGVFISETLSATRGEKKDYIEIGNVSPSVVNLKGYTLSQRPGEVFFTFPDVNLAVGQYLLVYCDGETRTGDPADLHAPIKIRASGEQFYLADATGRICDVYASGKNRDGMSSGRVNGDTSRRVFFAQATPGQANSGDYYTAYAPVPSFSAEGGLVKKGASVSLSAPEGFTVVYTTDGSLPTENAQVYRAPVRIEENTVIRAAAFGQGCALSECATQTYLIENPHTIPIVCVSGREGALMGQNGILRSETNRQEYPVHVEYFDENVRKAVEFDCGARHFGGESLTYPQKGLKLLLREVYGATEVSYPFFDECGDAPTTFSSLLLRPSGQDQDRGKLRDELVAAIVRGAMDMDYQEFRACALYVNGRYWGLYYIREPLNAGYFENHYGYEEGDYDLIKNQVYAQEGSLAEYEALTRFCEENDLSLPENYAYVCSVIDVDSLINFWILETYFDNLDSGNVRCYKTADGKWRWIAYDFDLSMYDTDIMQNRDFIKEHILDPAGHGFGNINNAIIRKLLDNPTFRARFLSAYCYHIRHTFAPGRTVPILEAMADKIDGEIRLNSRVVQMLPYDRWQEKGPGILRTYLESKPAIALRQLQEDFNLSDQELAALMQD